MTTQLSTQKILLQALLHALALAAYVFLIAWFFQNASRFFGDTPNNFFAPAAFLSLFVMSAAITGSLVGLRPVIWFFEGQKKQAIELLVATIGWFAIITTLVFVCLKFTKI